MCFVTPILLCAFCAHVCVTVTVKAGISDCMSVLSPAQLHRVENHHQKERICVLSENRHLQRNLTNSVLQNITNHNKSLISHYLHFVQVPSFFVNVLSLFTNSE